MKSPNRQAQHRKELVVRGVLVATLLLALGVELSARPGRSQSNWDQLRARFGLQGSQVGLVVIDDKGRQRGAIHPRKAFVPASNQKILVVAAALKRLGPDFRYTTSLWSDRLPEGGVLDGDVVVSGGGDPNISGRFTGEDPTAIFRQWARSLRRNGLSRVTGDLLIDDFIFDDQRLVPTWKKDQFSRWYSAQIGALNLNDNCLDFVVFPGRAGAPARYQMAPKTSYVRVENRCRTVSKGTLLIGLDRYEGSNDIVLKGKVPRGLKRGTRVYVTIDDPGLFFGTVLKEVFSEEGISIGGRVVRDRSRLPPFSKRKLLHEHSSSLQRDLQVILKKSQNLHAEVLLKALGASGGRVGSVASGRREIEAFLRNLSLSTDGLHVADGSGLSPANRVAPETLARVLYSISKEDYFELFLNALAVPGEVGTLRRRFRRSKVRRFVHAKTGTIAGVSTLSGYIRRPKEVDDVSTRARFWSFSILVNGSSWRVSSAAKRFQEAVVEEIYAEIGRAASRSGPGHPGRRGGG